MDGAIVQGRLPIGVARRSMFVLRAVVPLKSRAVLLDAVRPLERGLHVTHRCNFLQQHWQAVVAL
jgi:hypothetical protein